MSFRNLELNKSYINKGDYALLDTFFNPLLSRAVEYKSSVGFFSATILTIIKDSLSSFLSNNGKIKLIVSTELRSEDIEAIKIGYELREEIINKNFIKEFGDKIEELSDDELELLSNLIAQSVLDIKIAVLKDTVGIYHDKLGILTDDRNNTVVYYGSANFTKYGYVNNYEKIRIARSWVDGEEESVLDENKEFNKLWENENDFVETYDFMDSIKKKIISVSQSRGINITNNKIGITLYKYQEEAIDSWKEHNYNGFFVMATGTGKTLTSLYGVKSINDIKKKLIVLVVPYRHLLKQWEYDIRKVFPNSKVVLFSSDFPKKYNDGINAILSQKFNDHEIFFVTTKDTFLSNEFKECIDRHEGKRILIVDEAHRYTNRPEWTNSFFEYKLGLSATPLNGKNNTKGLELIKYFGGVVYNLPIEDALKRNCLVNYNYNPIIVHSNEEEEKEFDKIGKQMAQCFDNKGNLIDKEKYNLLYRKRLRVIATIQEKLDRIEEFILMIKPKHHFIIYCGDGKINIINDINGNNIRNIDFVKEKLAKLGYKASQFTCDEDINTRMQLIDAFNEERINTMIAIRCLDEGINIPSIASALILASNDDYREFVQRRGRILRKYKNKETADIFDIIVLPNDINSGIAKIELRRFKEYARLSLNKDENLKKLYELESKYNLSDDSLDFDINYEEDEINE